MNKGVFITLFGFLFLLVTSFLVLLTMVLSDSISEYKDNKEIRKPSSNQDSIDDEEDYLPRITLEEDYIKLEYGADYTLPKATAYDEEDGDIDVVVRGTLDTNKWGIHEIIYEACDSDDKCVYKTLVVEVESPELSYSYEKAWNIAMNEQGVSVQLKSAKYNDDYLECEFYIFNRTEQIINRIKGMYIILINDDNEIVAQAAYEDIITTINADSYVTFRIYFSGQQLEIMYDNLDEMIVEYNIEYRFLYEDN